MTDEQWEKISSRVRAVFNFGIERSDWLANCRMARFIAAVPFLAGCDKPETTSLTHLSVYMMSIDESTRDLFFHKSCDDDDLFSRIFPISCFKGGDRKIIDCCMNLIALNMLSNYQRDSEKDLAIGKYNPVSEGRWNYSGMSDKLICSIKDAVTPEISAFYTIDEALRGIWRD